MENKEASRALPERGIDAARSSMTETKRYFAKAVILMAALTLVGGFATILPSTVIPFVVASFAVLSTAGAMYGVVVRRLHRQYKLKEGGKFSQRNRGWVFWLIGYFALSLFSAFLFVLESPRWNAVEWAMVWTSVFVYYFVFRLVQRYLGKEYKAEYCKASAMKASLFVVAALLCFAYTIISAMLNVEQYTTFNDAVQNTFQPFEGASSALLCELGKVSVFGNALTAFGLNQISAAPFAVVVVVRFVVYFSVFAGIVSLLGSCLLDWGEVKRELQLLPVDGEFKRSDPLRKSYLAWIVVLFAVSLVAFGTMEDWVANKRAVDNHTVIDTFIDEQTENITFLEEKGMEEARRLAATQAQIDEASRLVADCEKRRAEELAPMVDSYFDQCLGNVDSYLDWQQEGFFGGAFKLLNSMNVPVSGTVRDEFGKQIRSGVDASALEGRFAEYQEELKNLKANAAAIPLGLVPGDLLDAGWFAGQYAEGTTDASLDLWACLEGEGGAEKVGAALLDADGADRETLRSKAVGLVEEARADALAAVNGHRA